MATATAHPPAGQRRATIYGLLAATLWGLSFLSTKVAVAVIPPMTLTAAQCTVACLALPAVVLLAREHLRVALGDLPILAVGGVVGVTVFFYCQNTGILKLSASESSLIIATVPVISVLCDRLFLGTRLLKRVYAGSLLSFAGVALIVARPSLHSGASLQGYAFMFGAVLAWVGYGFATRSVARRYGRLSVTFWQSLFGILGSLPFALRESRAWKLPGALVVLNVLFLGLMVSVAAFGLFVATIDRLGVGKASLFINLIPVVAVIAAFFLLGDRLGPLQWAGGSIVLTGVFLATGC